MALIQCVSPVDGSVFVERKTASAEQIRQTLGAAVEAQKKWKNTPVQIDLTIGRLVT